jgi:hypothetical protein
MPLRSASARSLWGEVLSLLALLSVAALLQLRCSSVASRARCSVYLLDLCCSCVAAVLQLCCSSVASRARCSRLLALLALLASCRYSSVLNVLAVQAVHDAEQREREGAALPMRVSIRTFVPVKQVN